MSTRVQIPMKPAAIPARSLKRAQSAILRRKCACGASLNAGGECAECEKKRLQRSAADHAPEFAPPIVHDVLRSPGQPLDAAPGKSTDVWLRGVPKWRGMTLYLPQISTMRAVIQCSLPSDAV